MVDLKTLQQRVYANKVNKHFNVTDLHQEFCLLYGEVAEAFDAWEKHQGNDAIGLELADIVIYTLGIAEILGITLEEALTKKIDINEKRVYINGQKVNTDTTGDTQPQVPNIKPTN